MTRLPLCICMTTVLLAGCKSRYGFTDMTPEAAVIKTNDATPTPAIPGQGSIPTTGGQPSSTTSTPPSGASTPNSGGTVPSTDPDQTPTDGVPTAPGGPVAGVEVWQDGAQVTTVTTGKLIQFKPTSWTRDTSATSGCEINRGIVQSSWTIGSRASADIQRFAGQECRLFDYAGTFTKAGNVTIQLDVISADGEQAHAETVITVVGDSATGGTPTQK